MNILYLLLITCHPHKNRRSVILSEDFKFVDSSVSSEWADTPAILSEISLRKKLQESGLRYKMTKTDSELNEENQLSLEPLSTIGPFKLYPPCAGSLVECLGFNSTSNNKARRQEKINAKKKIKKLQEKYKPLQSMWLIKYGYKRFVGDWFYADQLSSDTPESSGGFNMKKGGYYPGDIYKPPD